MIEISKGPKVKIVSQVMDWQGTHVLDVRTYVVASKGPQKGKWIPTGKGIQLPATQASAFLSEALADVRNQVTEEVPLKKKKATPAALSKPKPSSKVTPSGNTHGFLL